MQSYKIVLVGAGRPAVRTHLTSPMVIEIEIYTGNREFPGYVHLQAQFLNVVFVCQLYQICVLVQ